jgi:hypothetical protein
VQEGCLLVSNHDHQTPGTQISDFDLAASTKSVRSLARRVDIREEARMTAITNASASGEFSCVLCSFGEC